MSKEKSTEERILIAARKIFLDKGLVGARMQDIADEAGINKALLHYYFRNKEKLFETIFSQIAAEFLPRIFSILQSDNTIFEKIEMFCSEYILQQIKTPYVPMFIIKEMNRDPKAFLQKVLKNKRPPLDKVIAQIEREIKNRTIKPIEPIQLLINIISLCIFPFLARPMIQTIKGLSYKEFEELMRQRITEVPKMIIHSIKV